MNTIFTRAYVASPTEPGPLRFIASTQDVARDGLALQLSKFDLTSYLRNPALLWCHKYDMPPIGRVVDLHRRNTQLIGSAEFDQGDPFAREIERKYRDGYLNAFSIAWQTVERNGRTVFDLLDCSCVPVPSDPGALLIRSRHARAVLRSWAADEAPNLATLQQNITEVKHLMRDIHAGSSPRTLHSPRLKPE